MIKEIADILVVLQNRGVRTYDQTQLISLLERPLDRIEFKHVQIHEVDRFISLVKASAKPVQYIVRHLSHETQTRLVERSDRIMGALSLTETLKLRCHGAEDSGKVVCAEIHRTYETPENRLLCLVLLAMALYCDTYLKIDGITGPGERLDDNLLSNLRSIRHFANTLLKTKMLRDILPTAVTDLGDLKQLFEDMLIRIRARRISRVYASLYRLFHDWRYYVWVASAPPQTLQRNLWQYFLFDLKGEDRTDKLYECWVFYRVLRTFCEEFNLTMKEIERGESGVATFVSKTDPKLKVAYQRIVRWGWEDSAGKQRVIIPDIIVTRDKKALLIVDAKNRHYYPGSCLHQMERYLGAEGCRCDKGVLVFSSAPTATWTYDARGTRRVIYTHLTPALASTTGEEQCNQTNLSKIVGLVKQELAAPSDALSASAKVGKVTRSSTVQE